MRAIIAMFLLSGILMSCAPSQQTVNIPKIRENWLLSLEGAESYQIETQKVEKIENGLIFSSSTDSDRASLISISGEKEDGDYSSIIVFVSKTQPANYQLLPENINEEEGVFCMAPFSLRKNKIEGFFFRGYFSRFSSFRSTAEFDGKCVIQRI
jgi:hypothetical protein